jgi:hypothetical protein
VRGTAREKSKEQDARHRRGDHSSNHADPSVNHHSNIISKTKRGSIGTRTYFPSCNE